MVEITLSRRHWIRREKFVKKKKVCPKCIKVFKSLETHLRKNPFYKLIEQKDKVLSEDEVLSESQLIKEHQQKDSIPQETETISSALTTPCKVKPMLKLPTSDEDWSVARLVTPKVPSQMVWTKRTQFL